MQYKIVSYLGSNIYQTVCQGVQQTVYNPLLLDLNSEYEGTLDYTRMVSGYPLLRLDELDRPGRRGVGRGMK